jgi:hypothetical protein
MSETITRAEVNQQLDRLVSQLRSAVAVARKNANESTTCGSWLFGDKSACAAILKNINDLEGRLDDLEIRVEELRYEDLTTVDADWIVKRAAILLDGLEYQGSVGGTAGLRAYLADTAKKLGAFVGQTIKVVAGTVGEVAGGIAGGVASNLGFAGWVAVLAAVGVYAYGRSR